MLEVRCWVFKTRGTRWIDQRRTMNNTAMLDIGAYVLPVLNSKGGGV